MYSLIWDECFQKKTFFRKYLQSSPISLYSSRIVDFYTESWKKPDTIVVDSKFAEKFFDKSQASNFLSRSIV